MSMVLALSSKFSRTVIFALVLSLGLISLEHFLIEFGFQPISTSVYAQEKKKPDQRKTRRTPALRNKVYEKLAAAQAALEIKDFATARKTLDGMLEAGGKNELNSYELANVYNLYAFIYYSEEDYDGALRAYRNVIKQPDIPLALEINTRFTVAQLYFVQEKWQRGIDELLDWFELNESPSESAYVLLAQGYYQLKDYRKALLNVEKAISMYKGKNRIPKEQWYNLARFLYFDKNDITSAVNILEELIKYYPKKQYWVQLSHLYGEQKKEDRQLSTMETAYVQDFLERGTEQVTMAYLYLNGDVPYKAAKVLDKGLDDKSIKRTSKNYEVMGNAWRQAQEIKDALPAMEEAARRSDAGELYARLGNIYLDNDQYANAIKAIKAGLKRGGVKRVDTAQLVLGMAYFNSGKYSQARKAFKAAGKDKRSVKYSKQWIKYMDSELERMRQLREG